MRKLGTGIVLFLLVVQLFVGTTGLPVHKHHCLKEGTSISFYIAPKHSCEKVIIPSSCGASSCCASPITKTNYPVEVNNVKCCSNSFDFVFLDTEYTVDNEVEPSKKLISCLNPKKIIVSVRPTRGSIKNYRAPPPLSTQSFLALYQTYLI